MRLLSEVQDRNNPVILLAFGFAHTRMLEVWIRSGRLLEVVRSAKPDKILRDFRLP